METPKCAIIRCDGPTADDGSIIFAQYEENGNNSCHQTFVPMNSCIGNKGYPVGMVCTICCDCTSSFVSEMHQTRGYKEGFSRKWTEIYRKHTNRDLINIIYMNNTKLYWGMRICEFYFFRSPRLYCFVFPSYMKYLI